MTPNYFFKQRLRSAVLVSISMIFASSTTFGLDITDATTESVATSTADSGVAGDVLISSTGSISLEDTTGLPAVTLDSSNSITVEGDIAVNNTDSIQGLLLEGGNSSTVTLSSTGSIQIIEDYDREDTDDDGDADGAFATGTNRSAILVSGGTALDSDITLESGSVIYVEGNDSGSINIAGELLGNINAGGSITLLGNNSSGIAIDAAMTGDIRQSGTISSQGEGNTGVEVNQAIDGGFDNSGSITAIGFFNTTSNYIDPDLVTDTTLALEDRIDADEILLGGSAVQIQASISEGVLNNGIVDNFVDETEAADETKDTVEDFDENRSSGSITGYGSAPAISIAAQVDGTTDDLVIGLVVEDVIDTLDDDIDLDTSEILATFNYGYGFINRGTINGIGLNDGLSATGLLVEGASDGSRSTRIDGGIFNSGSLSATSNEGNATSISIGDYAQVPTLWNEGVLFAFSESTTETAAIGLQVSALGQLDSLTNIGSISASAFGDDVSAIAIQDNSGTLLSILNQGIISAVLTERDAIDLGSTIAIDLSSTTQSIQIRQEWLTPTDDFNADDLIDTDDVTTPAITGDIYLGTGDDSVDIQAGTLTSTIFDFGDGVDELLVSNGASVVAGVENLENLNLDGASLELSNTSPVMLDSLSVTNESDLLIAINLDSADALVAQLQVAGNVVIDDSSKMTTKFIGFESELLNLTLIEAADIDLGTDIDLVLDLELPAIYSQVVTADATSLSVSLETKTAEALGLKESFHSSFDALLGLAEEVASVGTQLTDYTDEASLLAAYSQLLPDTSQITAQFLASQLDLSTSMTGNRLDNIGKEGAGQWYQYTIGRGSQRLGDAGTEYAGRETNISIGFDNAVTDNLYLGLNLSLRTSDYMIEKLYDHRIRSTAYDTSIYSGFSIGRLNFNNSITGGVVDQYSDRKVNFGEELEEYDAKWRGTYFSGSSLLSFQQNFGKFYLRPSVSVDYLSLSEEDYTEAVSSDTGELALSVLGTDTTMASGTVKLNFGFEDWIGLNTESGGYGDSKQFYVGFRSDLSSDVYESQASFVGGSGFEFDIYDDLLREDTLIFGVNITMMSREQNSITVGYAGEQAGDFTRHSFQGEIRIRF